MVLDEVDLPTLVELLDLVVLELDLVEDVDLPSPSRSPRPPRQCDPRC